jgi:hypothetical protein
VSSNKYLDSSNSPPEMKEKKRKEKKRKESDENRNNCNEGMKEWEPYLPMVRR